MDPATDVTLLLAAAEHNETARLRLYQAVEAELRRIAAGQMRHEHRDGLLDTYVLVNDAFDRLYRNRPSADAAREWQDRRHFFRVSAKVMRQIRIDHARRRHPVTPLDSGFDPAVPPSAEAEDADLLLALDRELNTLREQDEQAAAVFELRFFGVSCEKAADGRNKGLLADREAAEQLGWTRYTVRCAWQRACRFLQRRLPALGLTPPE